MRSILVVKPRLVVLNAPGYVVGHKFVDDGDAGALLESVIEHDQRAELKSAWDF